MKATKRKEDKWQRVEARVLNAKKLKFNVMLRKQKEEQIALMCNN